LRWLSKWRALAARIDGLGRGAELFAATRYGSSDPLAIQGRALMPEMARVRDELVALAKDHGSELPPAARGALERFMAGPLFGVMEAEQYGVSLVVPWVILRSEFEYLIRDHQQEARSQAELAFEHLRRLIAVDTDVRAKWQAAIVEREERCERLGAVHLLSHGIWAFKVKAVGESTDLVFGDRIEEHATEVQRTARALVATEWKIVRSATEVEQKASEARKQLKLYERGALTDLTLTSTRFVVLVSAKGIVAPSDFVEDDVTYRHVLVEVDPESPSKAARTAARRDPKT
jgi:hypothetical protein